MSDTKLLEIKNLSISFPEKKHDVEVVGGVSLDIEEGKTVGVVGESGCGKTLTALSVMGLLPIPPARIKSGEVLFRGKNLLSLNERQLRHYRGNRISMIFQEPMSSLNPVYTVGDQIGEVIRVHNKISAKDEKKRVLELLDTVGIPAPDQRYSSYPHELSGGMCQRVMIAMALACNPELLIADEPTTALDVTIQAGILSLIKSLQTRFSMSVMLISHDLGVVSTVADYVYVLYAGKVVERGETRKLFSAPAHPYTIGLVNSVPGRFSQEYLHSIRGVIPPPGEFPKGCRFNNRCDYAEGECFESEPQLQDISRSHSSACFRHAMFAEKEGQMT